VTKVRRKLPFKEVKQFTISILNDLDKEIIGLEELVYEVYTKVVEGGRNPNNKTASTVQRRYNTIVSKVAKNAGWSSYRESHAGSPKTYLRRMVNVHQT
tara:strand:+ start:1405 stop:1701 length:297 start_codon:yes stop_codon:yes gene_type:complete